MLTITPGPSGEVLDHYHIENLAARGGMADIFRATDMRAAQIVAIKGPSPRVRE